MSKLLLLPLLLAYQVFAEPLVVPPKHIVKVVERLSYRDFPNTLDILAIIRIESAFKANALNPEIGSVGSSRGLMQVQNGSMEMHKNLHEGVSLLRSYYKSLGSREGAVKAYNIGITAYRRGKHKISAEQYWQKFKKRRSEYVKYYNKMGGGK